MLADERVVGDRSARENVPAELLWHPNLRYARGDASFDEFVSGTRSAPADADADRVAHRR